jgi:serine/threonine-protein kinase
MGEVYRAFDATLRRSVALKVLRTDAGAPPSPEQRARFLREARAAAALRHPGIVTVFDVGEVDDIPYIAMELLDGPPLGSNVLRDVGVERKASWLVQVAQALSAAHAAGFVHRDIKPSNLIVCSDDTIKVLDFGIVRALGVEEIVFGANGRRLETAIPSFRTAYGDVLGAPRYIAPEQAAGWTPTHVSISLHGASSRSSS